jgi:hypothetical protein
MQDPDELHSSFPVASEEEKAFSFFGGSKWAKKSCVSRAVLLVSYGIFYLAKNVYEDEQFLITACI